MGDQGYLCRSCGYWVDPYDVDVHIDHCSHELQDFIDQCHRTRERDGSARVSPEWYVFHLRTLFHTSAEYRTELFKLIPIDVWPTIFKYLSIEDIYNMLQTGVKVPREAWDSWMRTENGKKFQSERLREYMFLHMRCVLLLNMCNDIDTRRKRLLARYNAHYEVSNQRAVTSPAGMTFMGMEMIGMLEQVYALTTQLDRLKRDCKSANLTIENLETPLETILFHTTEDERAMATRRAMEMEENLDINSFARKYYAIDLVWRASLDVNDNGQTVRMVHVTLVSNYTSGSTTFEVQVIDRQFDSMNLPALFYDTGHITTKIQVINGDERMGYHIRLSPECITYMLNTPISQQVKFNSIFT